MQIVFYGVINVIFIFHGQSDGYLILILERLAFENSIDYYYSFLPAKAGIQK